MSSPFRRIDRNAKAKHDDAVSRARKMFADQVARGDAGAQVLDRTGLPITEGDYVLGWVDMPKGVIMQVTGIAPILDPGAPAGMIRMNLIAEFPMGLQAGQRTDFVILHGLMAAEDARKEIEAFAAGRREDAHSGTRIDAASPEDPEAERTAHATPDAASTDDQPSIVLTDSE